MTAIITRIRIKDTPNSNDSSRNNAVLASSLSGPGSGPLVTKVKRSPPQHQAMMRLIK